MKNLTYAFLFLLACLAACSKDSPDDTPVYIPDPDPGYTDAIYKATGCKPENPELIVDYKLFTDSIRNIKYLTGSKVVEGLRSFWVSQYNSSGDCVWEVIQPDKNYLSRADEAHLLSTGDLVIGKVLLEEMSIKEISPVIINSKGKPTYVGIYSGFYYSEVAVFDRFFICRQNEELPTHIPIAKEWGVQIDNSGKVMRQAAKMYIPEGKTLWPTDTTYINMTPAFIERGSLLVEERAWRHEVDLPPYTDCTMDVTLEGDKLSAVYYLLLEDGQSKDTVTYTLSYQTGKNPVKVTGVSISPEKLGLLVGEEQVLKALIQPQDASVTTVTWSSSDKQIATIDDKGKVKAFKKGQCILSATTLDGGFKADCVLKVLGPEEVTGIELEDAPKELLIGKSQRLKATVRPSTAINKNIKWSSSDSRVASVDRQGVVVALSEGTALITAETEDGGYKATCTIEIVPITRFIRIDFTATVQIFVNGYVTGSIYSKLTNLSPEPIYVTQMTVVDTSTGLIVAKAGTSILGELLPGYTLNVGGTFYQVYYPLFIWEYEYNGRTYEASQIFLQGNGTPLNAAEQQRLKQNALRHMKQRSQSDSLPVLLQRKQ